MSPTSAPPHNKLEQLVASRCLAPLRYDRQYGHSTATTGIAMNASRLTPLYKSISFRLATVVLSLIPFLALEGLLRLAGWQPPPQLDDPYLGIRETRPLFVHQPELQRSIIPDSRQLLFRPESFAWPKPEDEFRIFCLGGSTVQGRPFAIETAFSTWLELSLQQCAPSRSWDVINCGGVSYATYRLVPLLREILKYKPDLLILYTGHNEFLEDRSYAHLKRHPRILGNLQSQLSRLRMVQFPRSVWNGHATAQPGTTLAADVDALLDYRGGLADYHRDPGWRQMVIEHFQYNLDKMLQLTQQAGVPVILVDPVSNIKDTPPFKSVVDTTLSTEQRTRFTDLWSRARSLPAGSEVNQQKLLRQALDLDPGHAGAHFLLGHVQEQLRHFDLAKASYLRAKDEDICPLRMLEPMHHALRGTAKRLDVPLLELRRVWEQQARHGLIGDAFLLDHVHPNISGHQQIAQMLVEQMTRLALVLPEKGWKTRQTRRYAKHLATLDTTYYARGKERLKGLHRWTQGRSGKLKPTGDKASNGTSGGNTAVLPHIQ